MVDSREERIKKNLQVKIKYEGNIYSATVTSISRSGMSLRTAHVFPTYKLVDIIAKIGSQMVLLNASIRWVNEGQGETENEIGILLVDPPEEYVKHFD